MKCIIVDDDEFSRLVIRKCVERTDSLELLGVCSSAIEAVNFIQEHDVDLIFLDIEMPEMSGIDFIQSLTDVPLVILITSKKEYAVEAFEHDVIDYIVKPVEYPRFIKAVDKAANIHDSAHMNDGDKDHIFIKKDSRLVRLKLSDILYVEALADYVNIITEEGRFVILSTMKAMEGKLPNSEFARTHRSFIIRLDKIEAIEENVVAMGGKSIPISRSYKDNVMKRINLF